MENVECFEGVEERRSQVGGFVLLCGFQKKNASPCKTPTARFSASMLYRIYLALDWNLGIIGLIAR